jgi:hypothetical protein
MTADQDAAQRFAVRLAEARTPAQGREIMGEAETYAFQIPSHRRSDFWNELRARYNAAPKLILKESTAAAALNDLFNYVMSTLANK